MMDRRLLHHLVTWLGQWPAGHPLDIVGSSRREEPGWDGQVRPVLGVGAPDRGVLSVSPRWTARVRRMAAGVTLKDGLDDLLAALPASIELPGHGAFRATFRWTTEPAALPDAGAWLAADDPAVPPWLRVFGGEVLIARDPATGDYLAGVGIKRHDAYGHELAVGTETAARGQGLARRLVAQAARRVLDEGAIPTYLHASTNAASARVADAAGLPDLGWSCFGLHSGD